VTTSARAVLVAALAASLAAMYPLGQALESRRYSGDVVEELTYFPSGRLIKIADLGFSSLVADVMWLRGIQYYGEHRRGDRRYPLAEHIFSTITDVDPAFLGAYRFGAMVLADEVGAPVAAVNLLRKGMRATPDSWAAPFDVGCIYFITLSDYRKAAHYFRLASRLAGAPEIAKRFSAFAYRKAGQNDIARALWEEIYRSSSNKLMKESADYALKSLDTEAATEALSRAVERYRALGQGPPGEITDLVEAGLVASIPADPFGGTYLLDTRTGEVVSTTFARREAERTVKQLQRQVRRFADRAGRLPAAIEELKQQGLIAEVPRVAGADILYEPATGVVSCGLAWKESVNDDPVSRAPQATP